MEGDIQYVADTFLIERTFQILAQVDSDDGVLRKNAFDLSSILGSIGESIKSFIGGQVHGQDSGGTTRTVMNFLTPAIFFRLHPILGLLVTAGQMFGFDLYSIFEKIMGAIKPKLESGEPLSAEDINRAGQSAVPTAGASEWDTGSVDDMSVTASSDLLISLRELHQTGMLKKAQSWRGSSQSWGKGPLGQPFLPKSDNPLIRAFGFLSPMRRGSLLTGILVWFIKTVLLSAGLLAVGGVAAKALGVNPPSGDSVSGQSSISSSSAPSGMPAPTGAGSWNFRPNPGDMWVENLNGNQPHEQVLDWIEESYPILSEYEDIILRTPSFWNAVRGISGTWHPGQRQLVIPKPYKTRQEIINLFIGDVWRQVQQQMRNV